MFSKLRAIQSELEAPKNLKNTFGNYNYRSAEGILEALKPHLKKHDLVLTISDELMNIGERYYVKATVSLTDGEKTITTTALAREEETKKGMDGSQITGASSSYARKYALNGMFAIDDTKDSDATNEHDDKSPEKKEKPKYEDDGKPWYNDTDKHIDEWTDLVAEGKTTPKAIIENIESKYKLSKASKEKILNLF